MQSRIIRAGHGFTKKHKEVFRPVGCPNSLCATPPRGRRSSWGRVAEEFICWLHPVSLWSKFARGTWTSWHLQVLSLEAATFHSPVLPPGPEMKAGIKALMSPLQRALRATVLVAVSMADGSEPAGAGPHPRGCQDSWQCWVTSNSHSGWGYPQGNRKAGGSESGDVLSLT